MPRVVFGFCHFTQNLQIDLQILCWTEKADTELHFG